MKLRILILFIFTTASVLLCSSAAEAVDSQSSDHKEKKKTHFVIGVEDIKYYPLWYYDQSNGEFKGYARKMLDAFAESAGYEFEYRPYPIKRLLKTLIAGGVDLKFPDNPYWAKALKGDTPLVYSDPVIAYIDGVFVRPDNVGNGEESIKTLGSVLGFTPWHWLDKIETGSVIVRETPDLDALIQQTISGRVDGAYVNNTVMRYRLKITGYDGALVFDPGLAHADSYYFLSTIKYGAVVEEFNRWLSENQQFLSQIKADFEIQ